MKSTLLFFVLIIVFSSSTQAQQGTPLKINSATSNADLVATSLENHEHDDRFLFELNDELFEQGLVQKGSRIAVEVAAGDERIFEISRVSTFIEGTTSYIARDVNEQSRVFSFTYSNEGIEGLFHDTHTRMVRFTRDKESGVSFAVVSNSENDLFCTTDHEHGEYPDFLLDQDQINKVANSISNASPSLSSTLASVEDIITIDVMLVVTRNGTNWALFNTADGIDGVLAQAMNLSQSALDNSNAAIELRVVHIYNLDLPSEEQSQASSEKLRRITNGSGIYQEVHNARNTHGADLVAMIDEIGDTGGIAWVLTNPGGAQELGFSVNRIQQVTTGYTLVHEMGHNMGSFHSRQQPTQRAPVRGGVFHYSVGKQDPGAGFHTVMAYSAAGLTQAPVFSGPDVLYLGNPTGVDDAFTPENGARSLREIKRTMASNRMTTVEPPVPGISTNDISVELGSDQELVVPISITNTGDSRMVWNFDFDLAGIAADQSNNTSDSEDDILYSTSFESEDGFSTYVPQPAISRWRPLFGNNTIKVDNENAMDGTNHLRMDHNNSGATQTMVSPFIGALPLGKYEVTFDLYLPELGDNVFESISHTVYFTESSTGNISAGISIFNGEIFAWGKPEVIGTGRYLPTGELMDFDEYQSFKILYNTDEQRLQYFLNDVLIASNQYTVGANSPDQLFFQFANELPGTFMDIDNVQVRTLGTPYTWLQPEIAAGSIAAGEQTDVNLTFSGAGLTPGDYETTLKLVNNASETPVIEVPVTLTVNLSVSNEDENGIPTEIALEQNFPNPFNPTTNITFRLNNTSEVSLTVFNTLGQQVATIAQGRFAAGSHTVPFNAQNLASGVYVYQLQAGNTVLNRKLTLIK